MFTFFVILMVILAVLLCVVILMQAGKGGGLASTFGGTSSSTDSVMGGHQAAGLLSKLTWAGGGLFLFLGLVLSVMSSGTGEESGSILRDEFQQSPQTPQNPTSVLESEATPPSGAGQPVDEDGGSAEPEGGGGGAP